VCRPRAAPREVGRPPADGNRTLETVRPGDGLVLIASHDPLPLLTQLAQRWPGRFSVSYDERGPEVWQLRLVRAVA